MRQTTLRAVSTRDPRRTVVIAELENHHFGSDELRRGRHRLIVGLDIGMLDREPIPFETGQADRVTVALPENLVANDILADRKRQSPPPRLAPRSS